MPSTYHHTALANHDIVTQMLDLSLQSGVFHSAVVEQALDMLQLFRDLQAGILHVGTVLQQLSLAVLKPGDL